jgi:hypothetical protein
MNDKSKLRMPAALGMIVCSLMPIVLLYFIDSVDLAGSEWAYKHLPRPYIAEEFLHVYRLGLVLPVLTIIFAIWFVFGRSATVNRSAWVIFVLLLLHLVWLSWGILAFYLANQTFVMY